MTAGARTLAAKQESPQSNELSKELSVVAVVHHANTFENQLVLEGEISPMYAVGTDSGQ